ncbi:hypothetical protein AVEN_29164-1 [Araneus ventricosus]|uniref:Uncharacterized protein n=1 Tax=Araneus ventricosus TaxID=182803 RepID=A0A4Y2AKA2_ARAVE|nr:hypothetical protein AVEN_29164-1 [Araneus ventricosus]
MQHFSNHQPRSELILPQFLQPKEQLSNTRLALCFCFGTFNGTCTKGAPLEEEDAFDLDHILEKHVCFGFDVIGIKVRLESLLERPGLQPSRKFSKFPTDDAKCVKYPREFAETHSGRPALKQEAKHTGPKSRREGKFPKKKNPPIFLKFSSATTRSDVILQTVYAVGEGKRKNCVLRCLLDGGSQVSFIREDISKKLGLPSKGYSNLNIHTFAEKIGKHWCQRKVELTLRNINDPDKFITLDVIEAPVITTAEIKPPDEKMKSQLKSLGISLMTHPSADRESVSVLGADCLWKIAEEIKRINENAVALDTIFGWCIQGHFSLSELNSEESICSNLLVEEKLSTLESFWNIESLGVNSPDERLENEEA